MKNLKLIFTFLLGTIMVPLIVTAAPQSWDGVSGSYLRPFAGYFNVPITIPYIVATSTATSTFAGPVQSPCFSLNGVTCLSDTISTTTVRGMFSATSPVTYNSSTGDFGFSNPGYLTNITGLVTQGTNITISGTGTSGDPYEISATGGGGATTTINNVDGPSFNFATGTATGIGLNISTSTGTITFTPTVSPDYIIPLSASTTNWNNFFDTPSSRITAGSNLAWTGNTLNANISTSSINYWQLGNGFLRTATTTDGAVAAYLNATSTSVSSTINYRLGIGGITSPDAPLVVGNTATAPVDAQAGTLVHMYANGVNNARIVGDVYSNATAFGFGFQGRKSRGSIGAPSAPNADDTLAFIGGNGYGTTGFPNVSVGAYVIRAESGSFTDTSQPTYLSLLTTPTGTISPLERIRVTSTGNVGIGSSTPSSLLTVGGNAYFGGNVTATGTLNVSGQTTLANASSTNLTVTNNAYVSTLTSALVQTSANGLLQEYSGTSCTNQFTVSLSALAISTCASVSTSTLSAVGYSDGRILIASSTATGGWTWVATSTLGHGTVTSVAATVPLGFTLSGSPITTSGTLGFGYTSGYSLLATTTLGTLIDSATAKTTPADNDMFALMDSAASNIVKKFSWANLKTAIAAFFTTLPGITDGDVLTASSTATYGMVWEAPGGGGLTAATSTTYISSTTWNKPTGLVYAEVWVCGGGGGGEGGQNSGSDDVAGAGGGGGGCSYEILDASELVDASYSVTVGTGGAGGTGSGDGSAGNTSSFGAFLSATGGSGGGPSAQGGAGGTGSGGDRNITGSDGSAKGGINQGVDGCGGNGGSSHFGGGGGGSCDAGGGVAGGAYGGGGGGGSGVNISGNVTGGAGATGVVIVTSYTE